MSHLIRRNTFVLTLLYGLVVAQKSSKFHGDDSFAFPGPFSARSRPLSPPVQAAAPKQEGDSALSKSLQLAKEIDSIDSMDDFLRMVKGVPSTESGFHLVSRMGETGERSNAQTPIQAKCMPELQPVSLKQDTDPSTIYFPSCTRIMRCGGCCSHSLLACQPTATQVRNFEVVVVTIGDGSSGLNYREKRIVPLEEHTKCRCDCKIKEEHCNEKQTYIPEECRCSCDNVDETEKCIKSNDTKIWNPELCTCYCREQQECSTGFYFDQNICRCRQVPLSRAWFPPTKGADYGFGQTQKPDNIPPVIIALDAADPRRKPKPDPEFK